jgi:hypothetical protein
MFEDLHALSEFPEESATEVVLIAGKLHTEWKGLRQDGGHKVTTAKAQHLLCITRNFVIGGRMAV